MTTSPAPITIELPLPPKGLHPNTRYQNRFAISRATAKARGNALACTLAALGRRPAPQWPAAIMHCRWRFASRRARDDDNLTGWIKAYRDGVADAGIVRGSGDAAIRIAGHVVELDPHDPGLVLVLEPDDTIPA